MAHLTGFEMCELGLPASRSATAPLELQQQLPSSWPGTCSCCTRSTQQQPGARLCRAPVGCCHLWYCSRQPRGGSLLRTGGVGASLAVDCCGKGVPGKSGGAAAHGSRSRAGLGARYGDPAAALHALAVRGPRRGWHPALRSSSGTGCALFSADTAAR